MARRFIMTPKPERTTTLNAGAVVLPEELRRRFGLSDGATLVVVANDEGILLRPLPDDELEVYTPERKAEFFLNNVMDAEDYAWAVDEVRTLGLDPESIRHQKPSE